MSFANSRFIDACATFSNHMCVYTFVQKDPDHKLKCKGIKIEESAAETSQIIERIQSADTKMSDTPEEFIQ